MKLQGINSPRKAWKTNDELISSRIIGNHLADFCSDREYSDEYSDYEETEISGAALMFGQLIMHDCSSRASLSLEGIFAIL